MKHESEEIVSLIESLDHPDTLLLLGLLKVGTAARIRLAVYCLRDPDLLVRVAAVTSLKTRPEAGKVELDLILHLFLEDPDSRVQHVAAITLAKIGAPTDEIRTALRDAGRGRDPRLRKAAAAALELLQKKGPVPPAK